MTPAQKTLDELRERYAQNLVKQSQKVTEIVNSPKITADEKGAFIPLDLWEELLKTVKSAA